MWSMNIKGFLVFKLTHQMSRYVAPESERVNSYSVLCMWPDCDSVIDTFSDAWGK
jgi:hypothetical protein